MEGGWEETRLKAGDEGWSGLGKEGKELWGFQKDLGGAGIEVKGGSQAWNLCLSLECSRSHRQP